MVIRALRPILLALGGLVTVASAAHAADPPEAKVSDEVAPRVHHAPVSTAVAGEPLKLELQAEGGDKLLWIGVVYRSARGAWTSVQFQWAGSSLSALIPATDVVAPGFAYALEMELVAGVRVPVFASRSAPHAVAVLEERMDIRERAALNRLSRRRSLATVSTEYVLFGTTTGRTALPCASGQTDCPVGTSKIPVVDDQYWRVEVGYTYRPLRTVAEFSLRGGVVRGQSLVRSETTLDSAKYKVGLNYAAPSVRFRLTDAFHVETELLTSITEIGFSLGLGSAVLIGDPYGTKLTLGFETIGVTSQYFGSRFFGKLDVTAGSRVKLGPSIEVTDMPHAESYGVRLLGDVSVDIVGGFSAALRAGYQARRSTSGGPAVGASVAMGF